VNRPLQWLLLGLFVLLLGLWRYGWNDRPRCRSITLRRAGGERQEGEASVDAAAHEPLGAGDEALFAYEAGDGTVRILW